MTDYPLTPRTAEGIPIISTEGQKVYVEQPLWCQRLGVFENIVGGSPLMNVDGSASDENEYIIWNGTGPLDTGGDWTKGGTVDSAIETTEAQRPESGGTYGLDLQTDKNKYLTFINGSTIQPESYANLVIWINTQVHPAGATVPCHWRLAGVQKGGWCYIGNYIDEWTPGIWKKVEIPITDFGLDPGQTVDELRINFLVKSGQDYWFDDIHLDEAGGAGPQTYRIAPDPTEEPNDIWHVDYIKLLVVTGQSGWTSTVMFNLGQALESGLLIRLVDDIEGILWSQNFVTNIDLWGHLTQENLADFADSTRQVVWRLDPDIGRIVLEPTRGLEFVVRDDLSSLVKLRAFCNYGREVTT